MSKETLPLKRSLIFGTLFSRLFGSREQASPEAPAGLAISSRPLDRLRRELQEISNQADARLRESGIPGRDRATGDRPRPPGSGERERLLEERDAARQALEADIALLHTQLGTGIDRERLGRLRDLLAAHGPEIDETTHVAIEERIETSILRHLFRRAMEEAWHRFEELVEQAGLAWPLPNGLPANLPPEELGRLRKRYREEILAAFLAASPRQTADVIGGEVRVWVYGYPDRHSYLWLHTVFRGVVSALCAEFFAAALELWMWRNPELERELLGAVDEKLEGARRSLRSGIQSLSEAVEITSQVEEVCEAVIPELVWSYVAPRLAWVRTGEAAPTISVLAAGLPQLDPVCGMSLTSERVATRLEFQGRLFYFCSPSCRERFQASPSQFFSDHQPRRNGGAAGQP